VLGIDKTAVGWKSLFKVRNMKNNRISLYSQSDLRENVHYGYGHSFIKIQECFRKYRYNKNPLIIDWNSPRSNIQIYYGPHPIENSHYSHQYKIHMSQCESTEFEPHKKKIYSEADEFWTSGIMGITAAKNAGIDDSRVFLYEHGVNSELFKPFLRGQNSKIRFLHIDSSSGRKRSDIAEDAFIAAFGNDKNYELTLKYSHSPHKGKSWHDRNILEKAGDWTAPNRRQIHETLSPEEMVSLIHFHDVLIYPSEGEGFGMIPLEALATGMPVISTAKWCTYSKYLQNNIIDSKLGQTNTNWGYHHVGEWEVIDFDSVVSLMKNVANNIENQSFIFMNQSHEVGVEYNWDTITKNVLDDLFSRKNKNDSR